MTVLQFKCLWFYHFLSSIRLEIWSLSTTHTLTLQVVISQVKNTIHYVNSSKNSPSLVNLHWLEFIRFLFRTRASTLIHNQRRCSWHWSTFNSLIFACIGRIFAPLFNGLINLAVRQDCLVGHGQNWQHRFNPWIRGEQVASKTHQFYALKFFFCEVLNFINVLGQIYFMDFFLGGIVGLITEPRLVLTP